MDKKPDNVVFDEERGAYNASMKAYGTDLAAPAISIPNSVSWKQNNLQSVNAQFKTKFDELSETISKFRQSFEENQMLYHAKFNFEPIVGQTYHLYKNKNEENFLSIVSPKECNFNYIGSFLLNSEKVWTKISEEE